MLPDPRYSPFCWPFFYAWRSNWPSNWIHPYYLFLPNDGVFFGQWPTLLVDKVPLLGTGKRVIPKQSDWIFLCQSAERSYGILADGSLWGWGAGPLGDGTFDSQPVPVKIGNGQWQHVATSGQNTLAIDSSGALWAWGENNWGQLGNGGFWPTTTISPRLMLSAEIASVAVSLEETAELDPNTIELPFVEIVKSETGDPGQGASLSLDYRWTISSVRFLSPSQWRADAGSSPQVSSPTASVGDEPAALVAECEYRVVGVNFGPNAYVAGDAVVRFSTGITQGETAVAVNNGGSFSITNKGRYSSPPTVTLTGRSSSQPTVVLERRIVGASIRTGGRYKDKPTSLSLSDPGGSASVSGVRVVDVSCSVQSAGSEYTSKESARLSVDLVVPRQGGDYRARLGEALLSKGPVSSVVGGEFVYGRESHIEAFSRVVSRSNVPQLGQDSALNAQLDNVNMPTANLEFADGSTHSLNVERQSWNSFLVSLSAPLVKPLAGTALLRVVFPQQTFNVTLLASPLPVAVGAVPRTGGTFPTFHSPTSLLGEIPSVTGLGFRLLAGDATAYAATGAWQRIEYIASHDVTVIAENPIDNPGTQPLWYHRAKNFLPWGYWKEGSTTGGGGTGGGLAGGGGGGGGPEIVTPPRYWPEFAASTRAVDQETQFFSYTFGGSMSSAPFLTQVVRHHGGLGLVVSATPGEASGNFDVPGSVSVTAGGSYSVEPEVSLTSMSLSPMLVPGSYGCTSVALTGTTAAVAAAGGALIWGGGQGAAHISLAPRAVVRESSKDGFPADYPIRQHLFTGFPRTVNAITAIHAAGGNARYRGTSITYGFTSYFPESMIVFGGQLTGNLDGLVGNIIDSGVKVGPLGLFEVPVPTLPWTRELLPPLRSRPDEDQFCPQFTSVLKVFSDANTIFAVTNDHLWRLSQGSDFEEDIITSFRNAADPTQFSVPIYGAKASMSAEWNWTLESKETLVKVGPEDCHEETCVSDICVAGGATNSSSSSWNHLFDVCPFTQWHVVITNPGSGYGKSPVYARLKGGRLWGGGGAETRRQPATFDFQDQTPKSEYVEATVRFPNFPWGFFESKFVTQVYDPFGSYPPEEASYYPYASNQGLARPDCSDFINFEKKNAGPDGVDFAEGISQGSSGFWYLDGYWPFKTEKCPKSLSFSQTIETVVDDSQIRSIYAHNNFAADANSNDPFDISLSSLTIMPGGGIAGRIPAFSAYVVGGDLPSVEIVSADGSGASAVLVPVFSPRFAPVCLTQLHKQVTSGEVQDANAVRFLTKSGSLYSLKNSATSIPPLANLNSTIASLHPGNVGITSNGRAVSFQRSSAGMSHNPGNVEFHITNGGSRIRTVPRITITQPSSNIAVVDAQIDGKLVGIGVVSGGRGFTHPPMVTVSGSGGAEAVISGPLREVNVTSPGSEYVTPPKVVFSGAGLPATATCKIDESGKVQSVQIQSGGTYRSPPQVIFVPDWTLKEIEVTNGGEYESAPSVFLVGGSGSGGSASCRFDGRVDRVEVTQRGTYSVAPQVVFIGGNPDRPATATAFIDGEGGVVSINITDQGSFYRSPPEVLLVGGGSGATAKAYILGPVESVAVKNPGSGYEKPPAVVFTGGGGTGAQAVAHSWQRGQGAAGFASIDGSVLYCKVTDQGGPYQFSPSVTATANAANNYLVKQASDRGEDISSVVAAVSPDLDSRISGVVSSLTVNSQGMNYRPSPGLNGPPPPVGVGDSTPARAWPYSGGYYGPLSYSYEGSPNVWGGDGWEFSVSQGLIQNSATHAFSDENVVQNKGITFTQKPVVKFLNSMQLEAETFERAATTARSIRSQSTFVPAGTSLHSLFKSYGTSFFQSKIKSIKDFWSSRVFTTTSGKQFSLSDIRFDPQSPPVFVIDDPVNGGNSEIFCFVNFYGQITGLSAPGSSTFSGEARVRLRWAMLKNSSENLPCSVNANGAIDAVVGKPSEQYLDPVATVVGGGSGGLVVAVKDIAPSLMHSVVVTGSGSGYQDGGQVFVCERTLDFMQTEYAAALNAALAADESIVEYEFLRPEYIKPQSYPVAAETGIGGFAGMYGSVDFTYPPDSPVFDQSLLNKTVTMIDSYAECESVKTVFCWHYSDSMLYQHTASPLVTVEGVFKTAPAIVSQLVKWSQLFGDTDVGTGTILNAGIRDTT